MFRTLTWPIEIVLTVAIVTGAATAAMALLALGALKDTLGGRR